MSSSAPVHVPGLAAGLVAREVGEDLVVLNERDKSAHALSGAVADAYRALSRGEVPSGGPEARRALLSELAAKGLLESSLMTRRLMLQRAGTVAVAGSLMTIALPTVHAAASGHTALVVPTLSFTWSASAKGKVTLTGTEANGPVSGDVTLFKLDGMAFPNNSAGTAVSFVAKDGQTYQGRRFPVTSGTTSSTAPPDLQNVSTGDSLHIYYAGGGNYGSTTRKFVRQANGSWQNTAPDTTV